MTNAEKLKKLGLPEDFETLTEEERELWLTTRISDLRESAASQLAEAAQHGSRVGLLGADLARHAEGYTGA